MGPTASGKTDLAVDLVEKYPCELISVDSALVFKDMDIGTAKPDDATLARAPHKLISFLDPSESYSVAEFRHDALAEMKKSDRCRQSTGSGGWNHAVFQSSGKWFGGYAKC